MSSGDDDDANVFHSKQKSNANYGISLSRDNTEFFKGFRSDEHLTSSKALQNLIKMEKKQLQKPAAANLTRENVQSNDILNARVKNENDQKIIDIIRMKSEVTKNVEMYAALNPNIPENDLNTFRNLINMAYTDKLNNVRHSPIPSSSGISSALARVDKSSMLHRYLTDLSPPKDEKAIMSPLSSSRASNVGEQRQRSPQPNIKRNLTQTFDANSTPFRSRIKTSHTANHNRDKGVAEILTKAGRQTEASESPKKSPAAEHRTTNVPISPSNTIKRQNSMKSDDTIWQPVKKFKPANMYSAASKPTSAMPQQRKNTDANIYLANPLHKDKCPLCDWPAKNMAFRYRRYHPDCEFTMARLSPHMMKVALSGGTASTAHTCLFCEKELRYHNLKWFEHYAHHMGHVLYKCGVCKRQFNFSSMHNSECKNTQFDDLMTLNISGDGKLMAYGCHLCNYLQLCKENIVTHLQKQHELMDVVQIKENILTITLCCDNINSNRFQLSAVKTLKIDQIKELNEPMKMIRLSSDAAIQNTDKIMFASNTNFHKNCAICGCAVRTIVQHCVWNHPEIEVYTSRITDKWAQQIDSAETKLIQAPITQRMIIAKDTELPFANPVGGNYQAFCVFCEDFRTLQKGKWTEHITRHTGEYQYYCKLCKKNVNKKAEHLSTNKRCNGKHSERHRQFKLINKQQLYGYMCKKCNYVQLTEDRLISHVKDKHNDEMGNGYHMAKILELTMKHGNGKETKKVSFEVDGYRANVDNDNAMDITANKKRWHIAKKSTTFTFDKNVFAARRPVATATITSGAFASGAFASGSSTSAANATTSQRTMVAKKSTACTVTTNQTNLRLNNCKDVYLSNPKYTNYCLLCDKHCPKLTYHFTTVHYGHESYLARISPTEMEKVKANALGKLQKHNYLHSGYCVFCEKYILGHRNFFAVHLASHTNENIYECAGCQKKFRWIKHHANRNCAKKDLKQILNIVEKDDGLHAYACILCNFIQFDGPHVIAHLKQQHFVNKPTLDQHYIRIKLFNLEMDETTDNFKSNQNQIVQSLPPPAQMAPNKANQLIISEVQSGAKNDNRDMYPSNPLYAYNCFLCGVQFEARYLTKHYTNCHRQSENFLSRISCDMLEMTERECNVAVNVNGRYRTHCLFCAKIKEFHKPTLIWHLSRHTGELKYRCKGCDMPIDSKTQPNKCCAKNELEEKYNFQFVNNRLVGYVCKICNYVQMSKENVKKHIANNHSVNTSIDEQYSAVHLVSLEMKNPNGKKSKYVDSYSTDDDTDSVDDADIIDDADDADDADDETNAHSIFGDISYFTESESEHDNVNVKIEYDYPSLYDTVDPVDGDDLCVICLDENSDDFEFIGEFKNEAEMVIDDSVDGVPDAANACIKLEIEIQSEAPTPQSNVKKSENVTQIIEIESDSDDDNGKMIAVPDLAPNTYNMKPWTKSISSKSISVAQYLLCDVSLVCLFKCMGKDCAFTTNSDAMFNAHLLYHEQQNRSKYKGLRPDLYSHVDYMECSYCSVACTTPYDLIQHIDLTHKRAMLQCAHCFYRTVNAYAIAFHLEKYHRDREMVALVCGRFDFQLECEEINDATVKTKNSNPIRCCYDNRNFYATDHFIWHLKNLHYMSEFKCNLCQGVFKVRQAIGHLAEHNIGNYQCIYCCDTKNDLTEITEHMVDNHSNKLMIIATRFYRNVDEFKIVSSGKNSLIHVILMRNNAISLVRFRELVWTDDQLNTMNPVIQTGTNIGDVQGRALQTANPNRSYIEQLLDGYESSYRKSSHDICLLEEFEENILKVPRDTCYANIEEMYKAQTEE